MPLPSAWYLLAYAAVMAAFGGLCAFAGRRLKQTGSFTQGLAVVPAFISSVGVLFLLFGVGLFALGLTLLLGRGYGWF